MSNDVTPLYLAPSLRKFAYGRDWFCKAFGPPRSVQKVIQRYLLHNHCFYISYFGRLRQIPRIKGKLLAVRQTWSGSFRLEWCRGEERGRQNRNRARSLSLNTTLQVTTSILITPSTGPIKVVALRSCAPLKQIQLVVVVVVACAGAVAQPSPACPMWRGGGGKGDDMSE